MTELPISDLFENLPVPIAALVRLDDTALSKPLVELGLSPRVMRTVVRNLQLSSHHDKWWSQFHGISYETKVAGQIADWTGAGLATMGHVVEFTEEMWRDAQGLGSKGFSELVSRLGEHGLALGMMPLRDVQIWEDETDATKCACVRRGITGKALGTIVSCSLRDKVERGPLLSLLRCERIWCVVHSRWELIAAVTAKLRYRMYSLRHAGEPGNVHPASLRRG